MTINEGQNKKSEKVISNDKFKRLNQNENFFKKFKVLKSINAQEFRQTIHEAELKEIKQKYDIIDTRDYMEGKFDVNYATENGQRADIEQVFFYKKDKNGKTDYLCDKQGKTITFSNLQYQCKYASSMHPIHTDYTINAIPRLDNDAKKVEGVYYIKMNNKKY